MGKQDETKISFQLVPTSQELIAQKSCSFFSKAGKSGSSIRSSSESSTTSFDSNSSITSLSPSEIMEDATSSISSSSNGPLYQLSDLMDKLPVKRGLSKYYTGKSESFTSLASVENLEDLAKRENPYTTKRMKLFSRKVCSARATISKKASYSRNHFSRNCGSTLMARPPPDVLPVLKDF